MPDLIEQIQSLKADEIASRLGRLADEERTLRVLLQSARAKERADREKVASKTDRQGVASNG